MTRISRRAGAIVTIAAAVAATAGAAQAQQSIKATFLSGFPGAATWIVAFGKGFVPAVDAELAKRGAYKIDWNIAHSGQVVKPGGELEGTETGLGDIAAIPTPIHSDKLPLFNIPYVTPFTNAGDPVVVTDAYKMLQGRFSEFASDFGKFRQVQIGITTNVEDYILISRTPLKRLSDLSGKKVGAAGPNLPWVTPTGAAGVSTNLTSAYNSLSTGLYEAMIVWRQAMGAFKLCEPAPYMLEAGLGAASMIALTVNAEFWKALPDEVMKAFTEASELWNQRQIALLLDGATSGLDRCKTEYRTVVTTMAPEERAKWAMGLAPLALDWARQTDAKGYPATQILVAYMDFMRANRQPVLRQWDKQ